MKKIFLMFFLSLVLLAETGNDFYQRIGALALEQVRCDWRGLLANWDLVFLPGRPGYLGMTYRLRRRIVIWVRPAEPPSKVAAIIVHELAHRVDMEKLTPEQRTQWYKLRQIPVKAPWYPPAGVKTDIRSGAGDFAECVKWTFQGSAAQFSSQLGPPPTKEQQQTIRQWFAKLNAAGN